MANARWQRMVIGRATAWPHLVLLAAVGRAKVWRRKRAVQGRWIEGRAVIEPTRLQRSARTRSFHALARRWSSHTGSDLSMCDPADLQPSSGAGSARTLPRRRRRPPLDRFVTGLMAVVP